MKALKAKELRDKSLTELHQLLAERRNTLRELKFRHSYEQIENPIQIRILRRDIARILTVINEKQRQVQTQKQSK